MSADDEIRCWSCQHPTWRDEARHGLCPVCADVDARARARIAIERAEPAARRRYQEAAARNALRPRTGQVTVQPADQKEAA